MKITDVKTVEDVETLFKTDRRFEGTKQWITGIEDDNRINPDTKQYVLRRIYEEALNGYKNCRAKGFIEYWGSGSIGLSCLWIWTAEDRDNCIEFVSAMGH